jgi:hypothetical protein
MDVGLKPFPGTFLFRLTQKAKYETQGTFTEKE